MKWLRASLFVVLACAWLISLGGIWLTSKQADRFALELEAAWQTLADVARQVGCQAALAGADRLAEAIQDVASCAAQRALGARPTNHTESTFEPHAEARMSP